MFAPSLFAAEPQIIMPPDGFQSFGQDVDLDGNLIAVSDHDVQTAYVYERVDGVWQEEAVLATPDDGTLSRFGYDIAVDGNVVAVGAPSDEVGELSDAGVVYVFARGDAGAWTQVARLVAPTPIATAQFGTSLELDGGRLIVAASRSEVDQAAYLFEREASGAWTHTRTFAGEDGSGLVADDVSISGDTIAIARDGHGVFMYVHGVAGWLLDQVVDLSDTTSGTQLSLDGDMLAVGLPNQDMDACCPRGEGQVRVFARLDGEWTRTATLHSSTPTAFAGYGISVHLQDGLLAVDENHETTRTSAYRQDENGEWVLFFEDLLGIGMENGPHNRAAISAHTLAIGRYTGRDPFAQLEAWSIADLIPPPDDGGGDDPGGDDPGGDDPGGDDPGGDDPGGDDPGGDDPGGDDSGDDGTADGGDGGIGDDGTGDNDDGGNGDTAGGGGNPAADEAADALENDSGGGAMMLLLGMLASLVYVRRRASRMH